MEPRGGGGHLTESVPRYWNPSAFSRCVFQPFGLATWGEIQIVAASGTRRLPLAEHARRVGGPLPAHQASRHRPRALAPAAAPQGKLPRAVLRRVSCRRWGGVRAFSPKPKPKPKPKPPERRSGAGLRVRHAATGDVVAAALAPATHAPERPSPCRVCGSWAGASSACDAFPALGPGRRGLSWH